MSFPTTPTASSIKITGVSPTIISVTHSLKRQARSRGGQRWLIEAGYPAMTRSAFAPLWAFVNAQQGQYNTFTFKPPIYKDSSGSATGTLAVDNASGYSAGDSTITCDGLSGTLKAGDFITFAGHNKVYTLTADGTTTIAIEPPLISSVSDNEVITFNDVAFTMAFQEDKQELSMGIDQLVGFSIKLVEVV